MYDGTDVTFLEPVDTYEGGIYLLFYDEKYQFLDGSWPRKFPNGIDAANRAFQAVRQGNTTYYVYDHLLEFESGGVWIRGIYEAIGTQFILDSVVRVILIVRPPWSSWPPWAGGSSPAMPSGWWTSCASRRTASPAGRTCPGASR